MRIPLVICIGLFSLFLVSCSKQKNAGDASEAEKKIGVAERRQLSFELETIGDLKPSAQVDVKIEINNGRIKRISARTGQNVKKGDLLVELDDSDLRIQKGSAETEIEGAQLALDKAQLAADRAKKLVEADIISKEEADNLRLDAEIARNNLTKADKKLQLVEDNLKKTRIAAPIGGDIIELGVVEGQVVIGGSSAAAAGTVLMKIADLSQMLISAHINQVDVTRLKVGQGVHVSVDGFEGLSLDGEIIFIAPVASLKANIKGFPVDILIRKPDPRVRPGMSARVKIPIASVENALSVPHEAVFSVKGKKVVYVPAGEGFDSRSIEVGVSTPDWVEILSGLQEGEKVTLFKPAKSPGKKR